MTEARYVHGMYMAAAATAAPAVAPAAVATAVSTAAAAAAEVASDGKIVVHAFLSYTFWRKPKKCCYSLVLWRLVKNDPVVAARWCDRPQNCNQSIH